MIFRDHFLSDQVGFVYSRMGAAEAAEQFLDRIRDNVRLAAPGAADVLVPIILDGENAWEYYHMNGRPFLSELYRRITKAPDLDALTVSEALKIDQPRDLDHIFPGSWINANFDVWIGAQEDNKAWEYLLRARQTYDEVASGMPQESQRLAFEELMIAEGSDWCWWYGPEHHSDNRVEFDELYREHLANVYRVLGATPPDELSRPILMSEARDVHERPNNAVHAVIDGEVTSYFEWMGAGRYHMDMRSGSMHGRRQVVRDLYYGAGGDDLYLRIDFEAAPELTAVDLKTADGKSIALLSNPDVEAAQKKVFEARVPLRLLGTSRVQPVSFQLALMNGNAPAETVPPDGWIEFSATSGSNTY